MSKLSIIISSKNRLALFKRTLYSIANRPPSVPFELVVVDEDSTDDILGELRKYDFEWKFIKVDMDGFTKQTGYTKYYNSPCLCYNLGWKHSEGDLICLMGNEIIPLDQCFHWLVADLPKSQYSWVVSTCLDLRGPALRRLDEYGTNINYHTYVDSLPYRLSDGGAVQNRVPNYLSIFTRNIWEKTGGMDERYINGIGCEDADFMRKCFALPGFQYYQSQAVALHQNHNGPSHLGPLTPEGVDKEWFLKGVDINRRLYQSWDGRVENPTPWPIGQFVKEVITS